MKSFKFPVQSVLDLKVKLEENEKMQLLKLKAALNALQDELKALKSRYERSLLERRVMIAAGIAPLRLAEMTLYIREMDNQISNKNREIERMLEAIERQAEAVKEANKETKMLDRLREKHLVLYNKSVQKEEELVIDDFLAGVSKY